MQRCLTIKAAMLQGVIQEAGVGVKGRSEDKHARVEAVRPARIRSRWQLVSLKQLIHVTQNLGGNRSIRGQTGSSESWMGGCVGESIYWFVCVYIYIYATTPYMCTSRCRLEKLLSMKSETVFGFTTVNTVVVYVHQCRYDLETRLISVYWAQPLNTPAPANMRTRPGVGHWSQRVDTVCLVLEDICFALAFY